MQALCAFAHALEVSVRENQWIRWRDVHGDWLYIRMQIRCFYLYDKLGIVRLLSVNSASIVRE